MVRNVGICCSKIISVWVWVTIPVFSQQKTFGYKTCLLPDAEHFLYTDWRIGSTSTFLKMDIWPFREREEKPFLLYLFTLAASSGLVGVQRSLIVVPTSSVFPLTSSFVTFCHALFGAPWQKYQLNLQWTVSEHHGDCQFVHWTKKALIQAEYNVVNSCSLVNPILNNPP